MQSTRAPHAMFGEYHPVLLPRPPVPASKPCAAGKVRCESTTTCGVGCRSLSTPGCSSKSHGAKPCHGGRCSCRAHARPLCARPVRPRAARARAFGMSTEEDQDAACAAAMAQEQKAEAAEQRAQPPTTQHSCHAIGMSPVSRGRNPVSPFYATSTNSKLAFGDMA